MFTPQEIQEKTFVKAVFGGYDMASVDDFLEPLTEDYIALYKENAVLKSKMKILVEKLEEYRGQEDSMKKALMTAQVTSDQMLAEAEKKCAQMLNQAENAARDKTAESQRQIAGEEERIERARQAALNFIEVIEKDVSRHLDLLSSLKLMDLGPRLKPKAFDFEQASASEKQEAAGEDEARDETREIADEIEQNLEKVIGADEPPAREPVDAEPEEPKAADDAEPVKLQPDRRDRPERRGPNPHATQRFSDLQFGKNYDPSH